MQGAHTQYSQWRGLGEFETFYSASRFVKVDNDEARKPPRAILSNRYVQAKTTLSSNEKALF